MTDERSFKIHGANLGVTAHSGREDKRPWNAWKAPDWETFNRICDNLRSIGFEIGSDPDIDRNFPTLSGTHRYGSWGRLEFKAETFPVGCRFEFYQNVDFSNPNGGQYDFDRRARMPYLIGKQFEFAMRSVREHLVSRNFFERTEVKFANPDPLAYFNDRWDGEWEKKRGEHRFKRGEDGWPLLSELNSGANLDADKVPFWHGDTLCARDRKGYLRRGRVYGGINGMWMMVFGPGPRDCTHLSHWELFRPDSHRAVARKAHPNGSTRLKSAAEQFRKSLADLAAGQRYDEAAKVLSRLRRMPTVMTGEAA